jgi:pimeloyl-ACP methyl ester carboxylesterase
MNEIEERAKKFPNFYNLILNISELYFNRVLDAQKAFMTKMDEAVPDNLKPDRATDSETSDTEDQNPWRAWTSYVTDSIQRSALFWDTIRQRGNIFIEHEHAGKPPVLVFEYETIVDGRKFQKPVNYSLLRIIPPKGVKVDDNKRPFIIIDPRAGHGPGIGGSKKDSEVGVALKEGHPVYVVSFFPEPMPDQTMLNVSEAQIRFVEVVHRRHPNSPNPAIYGNCQGGWATMMVAASRPDIVGPVVINGAPLSYWSGSWSGGESENPMRYAGGLLGGAWMALLASDLGNGKFDGANLVQNFENLNLANTFWDKYYHLYGNVDTEPPRFLEFEKWWHGYSLMNQEEIHWIVDNLFIGNKLARGEVKAGAHKFFDLKSIRSPIIVFSSKGDNITPPQQALNWIADVYGSTQEIKANGQVIVGLIQEQVGHLGIFVSGRVAKKEHSQIVEVLQHIERLRPGLYLMRIHDVNSKEGVSYEVTLEEKTLEDLRHANKLQRKDEKPFEVVEEISQLNEKAYTLFVRPFIRPMVNETTAEFVRLFNPLRWQCWAFSDLNPVMWPFAAISPSVKNTRKPASSKNPYRMFEKMGSKAVSAWLDLVRDVRDATLESLFFQIYGSMVAFDIPGAKIYEEAEDKIDPRELPFVKEALSAIDKGGYAEAIARIAILVGREAEVIPIRRLEFVDKLIHSDEIMSKMSEDELRRTRNEQGVIVEFEPRHALESLPGLLTNDADKQKVLSILERAKAELGLNQKQIAIIEKVRKLVGSSSPAFRRDSFGKRARPIRPKKLKESTKGVRQNL